MLVIGQPDHPRVAVAGPLVVRDVELFQSQHARAATGQVVAGGGPHRADPDHDYIVALGHRGWFSLAVGQGVTPGIQSVPARGSLAIAAASTVRATRSSRSR